MQMNKVGIGLIGLGTVGSGVVELLNTNGDKIASRLGLRLELVKVAEINPDRVKQTGISPAIWTKDAESVIRDPSVQIVVELIGGTGIAREIIMQSLRLRKPVVTANKALLAEYGDEIFRTANENKTDIYFSASAGGGIPLIRALRDGLIANRIESIYGILNGTCNYILTEMQSKHMQFAEALKEAQKCGYAEADPSLDVDGIDTAHKALILASLAYGHTFPMSKVYVEGIRNLSEIDLEYVEKLGYRIKLLAIIKRVNSEIELRIHPSLIRINHVLASVNGVFNAVLVHSDFAGESLFYGPGAGKKPTASTVIADIADVARNITSGVSRKIPLNNSSSKTYNIRDINEVNCRQYLRFTVMDRPGVFAKIASVLSAHGISISAALQQEAQEETHVSILLLTHEAKEKDVKDAIDEVDKLNITTQKTVRLRIEDKL
jgi:homoserine dehydrogenase